MASDMRIPVVFAGGTARDAYLLEGDVVMPPGTYAERFKLPSVADHVAGCACCAPLGPAAAALAALFRARSTSAAPFFTRLVVRASPAGEAAVRRAIAEDVMAAARYYLAG